MKKVFLVLLLLIVTSCGQSGNTDRVIDAEAVDSIPKNQEIKANEEIDYTAIASQKAGIDCNDVYHRSRFNAKQLDSIISLIVEQNVDAPQVNTQFLNSLSKIEVNEYEFLKPIAAIIGENNTEAGIYEDFQHDRTQEEYRVSNKGYLFFKDKDVEFPFAEFLSYECDGAISKHAEHNNSLFIHSIDSRFETKVDSIHLYMDECLEYVKYSFSKKDQKKLMIASPFKLELDYKSDQNIDSLITKSFHDACLDCPAELENYKTFAALKGYPNVYFTYNDNWEDNGKLYAPGRSLIWVDGKDIKVLWNVYADQFGCPCL
ncbi:MULTISPECIES: hypothetical protein [unclassified Nonlabens]|uniref:hypothetical protein n=1 Tax=unclassified Nonlabens TaxID=2615035 RepID=UPI00386BB124